MAENEKVEIEKIVLKLGKREIVLTPEQAKKLKQLLVDMFGGETNNHYYYRKWWSEPYYWGTTSTQLAVQGIPVTNTIPYTGDNLTVYCKSDDSTKLNFTATL